VAETKKIQKEPLPEEGFYGDQIRFFSSAGADGRAIQDKIASSGVVVLGGGVVASHALNSLADSGVGSLRVADDRKVTSADLPGNALLTESDLNRPRGAALSSRISGKDNAEVKCEDLSCDAASEASLLDVVKGMDCALACLDSPSPTLLEAVNRAALRANVRLIIGQVYRGIGLVGPTVIPRQTACYKCYELRRNSNLLNYEQTMQYESRLRQMAAIKSEFVAPKPLAACIGGLVALEAIRLITQGALPQTAGRILRVDFFAPEMTYHRVLRMPNCPACGYERRRALPIRN
jgi:ribosomal protein S12 methylthiotransferase accessory factor